MSSGKTQRSASARTPTHYLHTLAGYERKHTFLHQRGLFALHQRHVDGVMTSYTASPLPGAGLLVRDF
jgi:hypothetical protein